MSAQTKPHMLIASVDDGSIYVSVECPHEDLGDDRPCVQWQEIMPKPSADEIDAAYERGDEHPGWEKTGRCWVSEWISDSAGEFSGMFTLPPFPVRWENGGDIDDSSVILTPWEPSGREEVGVDYCVLHHGLRNEDAQFCDWAEDDEIGLTEDGIEVPASDPKAVAPRECVLVALSYDKADVPKADLSASQESAR